MRWRALLVLLAALPALGQDAMNVSPCRMDGTDCVVVPDYATLPAPAGCSAGRVPIFLDSPVALGCDAGLTYNAATDTLGAGPANFAGTVTASVNGYRVTAAGGAFLGASAGIQFQAPSGGAFTFSSNATNGAASVDTFITRGGAATLQLGAAASATPVAQTLQAQRATGTNISGADLTVSAGKGTGLANSTAAGRRGDLKLRTQVRGSTGSTADTVGTDRAVFAGQVVTLTESSATAVLDYAVASGSVVGGTLYYTIRADDATDFQVIRGSIPFTAVNKGGTLTATIGTAAESVAVSSGTLTNTVTITTGTNSIMLNLNAVSSLTQTTLFAYVSALIDGTGVATTK